jgi:peptidoglycan/xylan/chitin deacetylase (PgdA/CDA1 family)
MYHRVLPPEADTFSSDAIVVRPETFAKQMRFLRRHFRLLSIHELTEHVAKRTPLPSRCCLVTFDDGWFDNFAYALPILRDENVPAVVFVATDYVGSESCFWQERVSRLLFKCLHLDGPPFSFAEQYLPPGLRSAPAAEKKARIRDAVDRLKNLAAPEIRNLEVKLAALVQAAGGDAAFCGDDRFMTWDQVHAMAQASGMSVGAHGCSHLPLTSLPANQVADELSRARNTLTTATETSVDTIAYPNGNFDDTVVDLTRRAGYQLGFTTRKGRLTGDDHPLKLARINVHEESTRAMADFLAAILQVFQPLRRPVPPK